MRSRQVPYGMACALAVWSVAGAVEPLRIVVVEGDGAINNIRFQRAKEPVVRVETEDGKPVVGAAVHFLAPTEGPGGSFIDGNTSATALTDKEGRASAPVFRPNKTAGQFQIRVTASYAGASATARITQTNAEPTAASHGSSKMIAVLAIVGGAVAGGVAMAARGGAKNAQSASGAPPATAVATPGTVITAGSPSIGAP